MGRIYWRGDDSGYYGDTGEGGYGGVWGGNSGGHTGGMGDLPGGYVPLPSQPQNPAPIPPLTPAPTTPAPSIPTASGNYQMPDFWKMYTDYMNRMPGMNLPDPSKYFDASGINRMYDTSRGNIMSNMYSAQSRAANQAGALAGSRNLVNSGGFTLNATNQAALPYTQALSENETARTGSLMANQQGLYNALMGQATARANQQQQGFGNVMGLLTAEQNQQRLDQSQNQFNTQTELERQRLAQQNEQFNKTYAQQAEQFGKNYDLERFTTTIMPMFQKQWQDFITMIQQQPGSDKLDWSNVYQRFMERMGLNMFGGNYGSPAGAGG